MIKLRKTAMAIQERVFHTLEEFERFVNLPENSEKLFEYLNGEIIEVPSNAYSSSLAVRVILRLGPFVEENDLGYVTTEQGGYIINGQRFAPDVAFISYKRQPELAHEGYNPNPPELAVEIVSPTDDEKKLRLKLGHYLAAGTLTWIVRPVEREVEVYAPGKPPEVKGINDTLNGGDVLPGFTLPVKDIFPKHKTT
jgi:Uma2 family endonuclease